MDPINIQGIKIMLSIIASGLAVGIIMVFLSNRKYRLEDKNNLNIPSPDQELKKRYQAGGR